MESCRFTTKCYFGTQSISSDIVVTTPNSISRRQFIAHSLAALASTLVVPELFGAYSRPNPRRFVLLSDTHANAPYSDAGWMRHLGGMWDTNLKQAVSEIVIRGPLPAAAFVLGDLAFDSGQCADYDRFFKLIEPVRTAGIPVHLILGNHDNRDRFWQIFPPGNTPVENRYVNIVRTEWANFFLLDSIDGQCGDAQLQWLANALDENADLPAITMVHHHPEQLKDFQALSEIISLRKHVKAHFFGHAHVWGISRQYGLYLINLPSTVWGQNSGWTDMLLDHGSMQLQLHTFEPQPEIIKPITLKWR